MLNRATNRSRNYTLPAPTGGLNRRDALDNMPETDAIVMDNYYPAENHVELRGGYKIYALAENEDKVETLMTFCVPENKRIFAATGGKIIDVTSGGDTVAVTNLENNQWSWVQFRNRLLLANGEDNPLTYKQGANDSWVWTTTSLSGTGLNKQKLISVTVSKQRVFYIEKNSFKYWYSSGVGEVEGTLNSVDLSSMFVRGGSLAAIACWTVDGGQGIDDLTVFITTEGEVLVYGGEDPGNASNWKLKGKYFMSRPIGRNCTVQYQGDVVIICEDGYVPLSAVLGLAEGGARSTAYSDKIRGLVLNRIRKWRNIDGWQGIVYPRGGYALFNVPDGVRFEQHVINMSSGAWCRFTDIQSFCWCLFEGRLYFGSKGSVYLFDEGHSDNGVAICGNVHQAYSDFGSPNLKKIQMTNPRIKSSATFALNIYTNMDFDDTELEYTENVGGSSGGYKWNACKWSCLAVPNGTKWSTFGGSVRGCWIGNNATGFKASLVFKTKTRGNLIEWYNTGFRFEQGGGIV